MSLKSEPFYWLICDNCGAKSTEGGEYAAWGAADTAIEDAMCSDWLEHKGMHYCDGCSTDLICPECGELADAEECVCGALAGDSIAELTP
jgi:hypothetical protein